MNAAHPIILRLRKGTPLLAALVAAVNQGIDAHLEAITQSTFEDCGGTLEARIDHGDLPCLTRRLKEANTDAARELLGIIDDRKGLSRDLDEFTMAYIAAALWLGIDDDEAPLEDNYGVEDLAPSALATIIRECQQFQAQHGIPQYNDSRYSDAEKAGHDFWLTRNGHGAGFWGRSELSEADQEKYTAAARDFGSCDIYVGDDGKLYVQ